MSQVTVADAIKAMEKALSELREIDPNLPVQGNFDQGGYMDCSWPLASINFEVEVWAEDGEAPDEDHPGTEVCVTAVFH